MPRRTATAPQAALPTATAPWKTGYDVHGKPWFWPDATRVMQSVVFGATGPGKTTLLKNIINGSRRCRVCLSLVCAMVIIRRRHSQRLLIQAA